MIFKRLQLGKEILRLFHQFIAEKIVFDAKNNLSLQIEAEKYIKN